MTRVLIVDGDPSNQYLLGNLLRTEGWVVATAKDGAEALSMAKAKRPNLVISEVGMVGMGGFELCRAWQLDADLQGIPFVFYSENHTRAMDEEQGLALGAKAYLVRPGDPARVLARLKAVLAGAAEALQATPAAEPAAGAKGRTVRSGAAPGAGGARGLDRRAESWETRCRRLESELEERRRSEAVLQQQARLVDLVPDAVIVLDFQGVVRFWNQHASALYGWSTNEAVGARFAELMGIDVQVIESVIHAVGQKGEWRGEMDLLTPTRRALPVGFRWSTIREEAGRPSGILVVGVDVSDRRRLEAQVIRAERMETFASLASGVAHEINNTLTPLLMTIPILRPDSPAGDLEKAAGVIQSGVRRVASAIRPLMALGLGVGGDRMLVPLRSLLQGIHSWLEETFSKSYEVKMEVADGLWNVVGDADQLRLVLKGFCVEARKTMPFGGRITIVAENAKLKVDDLTAQPEVGPGAFVRIRIEDNSAGVPPREVPSGAEQREWTAASDAVGAVALGAAVARRYGGFLEARAEPGQGSTVVLVLPAIAQESESAPERAEGGGGPFGNGEVILVVDDEVAVREFSRRTLERYGYQVLLAGDGAEGLVQFSRHRATVRLVVSDINMPVLDGVMFARAFRRMDREVPLLIWSGLDERGRRTELQTFGVSQFLLKPLSAPDFLAAIGQGLASRNPR
ncbi:MAG: response regulator [Verrucomicrobiales bacterium]|nr:response regulator [Verrucomicrobiales bacterium]